MTCRAPVLVEPYAGSAAVSLRALGQAPMVSYQGSKRGYAAEILRWLGVEQAPAELHLADVGPWYYVWAAIERHGWACLLAPLEALYCGATDEEVRPVFTSRQSIVRTWGAAEVDAPDVVERAALFLWVLCRSFSGQVGKGYAMSWGPGVGQRWSMAAPLDRLSWLARADLPRVVAYPAAESIAPRRGCVVYLDPPYPGTTGYRVKAGRAEDYRAVALAHQQAGCLVGVSLDRPVGLHARRLTRAGLAARLHSRQRDEWLSLLPGNP